MLKNDIVDGLCAKAFSRNFRALCDLSKQASRHDGADSAPLIHCRLGPKRTRYGSNTAVLADEIGDDPPVLYNAELLYRNRRNLAAPKATADQDCQDGAVRFALDGVRVWNAKKLPDTCRHQPNANTDAMQRNAMYLRDCGGDARIEETVIGRFLGEAPPGDQPQIDSGWRQFLFDEHRIVQMD